MKLLRILGAVIAVVFAVIIVLGLIAPGDFFVQRSTEINAPKQLVFEQMVKFRNWQNWSPWNEKDAGMKMIYSGIDGTVGSGYTWEGDPETIGSGEITNLSVKEDEEITYHMHFKTPLENEANGFLRVTEENDVTTATWGFSGEINFPWNILLLGGGMNAMMDADFNRGLQLLKDYVEADAEKVLSYNIEEVKFPKTHYAAIRDTVPFAGLQSFYAQAYTDIFAAMKKRRARPAGYRSSITYKWDEARGEAILAAAVPTDRVIIDGRVETVTVDMQSAYKTSFAGAWENIYPYRALDLYFKRNNLAPVAMVVDEHLNTPDQVKDPGQLRTNVYFFSGK
jgi:hypothetical protein